MGAPSKKATDVRTGEEFDMGRLRSSVSAPKDTSIALTSWTLEEIFKARDAQLRGRFYWPARMAESMRTDDALFVAFENRLAPSACIPVKMEPAKGKKAKAVSICAEADATFGPDGVGISPATISSIHACLANHEIAFAQNVWTVREDGSRVDVELQAWPIEFVRWDPVQKTYLTRIDPETVTASDLRQNAELGYAGGYEVEIRHGDGRWVIFSKFSIEPFKHGAILAAALVWARHAYGVRDWAKGSVGHGSAKAYGQMPPGIRLEKEDGSLTAEAQMLVDFVRDLVSGDGAAGVLPAGADAKFLTNTSTAWQVWKELVDNAEKAAARIYLGTDGTLGSQGGAPGVDVQALFGVAETKVEGDLKCIQRGIDTGTIVPWTAINFGDSSLAPRRRYLVPDAELEAEQASIGTRRTAFFADIAAAREQGFDITQDYVDAVAALYRVDAPKLKPVVLSLDPSSAAPAAADPAEQPSQVPT